MGNTGGQLSIFVPLDTTAGIFGASMKRSTLFLALVSASAAALSANEPQLDTQIVTTNGLQQSEFKAPFASEIHSSADIEKSGAINLYDYLGKYSSVTVLPSYGNTMTQDIDMRGFGIENGYQNIVVSINGRRLNNIDMVPQLLSNLPISSIERIEIIKGSGSVVYGDGAMAGAINIVTKDITGGEINIAGGSHGQSTASVSAGVAQKHFALQVLAENTRSDGTSIDASGDTDESDANNLAAHLKVFPVDGAEIRLGKERSWLEANYIGYISNADFNKKPKLTSNFSAQEFKTDVTNYGLGYQVTEQLSFDIDHAIEKKESDYSGWGSEYDYRSTNISAKWQENALQLVAGVQLFDGERDGGYNKTTKDNQSVFLQASYSLNSTLLSAGLRHEKVKYAYEETGSATLKEDEKLTAWEVGVNHQYSEQLSVFANVVSGYQAPDIDRFFLTDWLTGTTTFNSFINPAKHKTFNLGLNHLTANNKLKANIFYSKLTDEIFFNPLTYVNTNIDKSYKYGLELQDRWQVTDQLSTSFNYSYTLAKIDKEDEGSGAFNGKKLPGVSPHVASLGLTYQVTENDTVNVNETFRSKAYAINDFENNFSQKQRAYSTTDIGYQHKIDNMALYAQVNNLFDQRNGLWVGDDAIYPVNFTRTWYVGVRAKF